MEATNRQSPVVALDCEIQDEAVDARLSVSPHVIVITLAGSTSPP